MELIQSPQNEYIKSLKALHKKRQLREERFLAEGVKCAREALQYAVVERLLVTDESLPLVELAAQKSVPCIKVSQRVMEAVSDMKTPQTAAAVVRRQAPNMDWEGDLYVALENVMDPQNIGAIIRTADAMGAAGVFLSPGCCDWSSSKAVRASMGSVFHLPLVVAPLEESLFKLKQHGVSLLAGHLKGKPDFSDAKRICVLVGNESRGLLGETSAQADILYRIPMYGKAESLNAAVAAGIMMYQARMNIPIEK